MKKAISILLAVCLMAIVVTPHVYAYGDVKINLDEIYASYVPELVELTGKEIESLSTDEANKLFEKAFNVSPRYFTEEEVRTAIKGLSFALKFQRLAELSKRSYIESQNLDGINVSPTSTPSSTTQNLAYYRGNIGVAWVRDTQRSPLSLGEILSSYTLEVDYITPSTAAALLAASADYNVYENLVDHLVTGASATAITNYILAALSALGYKLKFINLITAEVIALVVDLEWNYLRQLNGSRMYQCYQQMQPSDLMKIEYIWVSTANTVSRIYSVYSPSYYYYGGVYSYYNIPNPFPGKYGYWYTDRCAVIYAAY